jgi:uncharacterized protein YidB (DUF937 family)
MGILDTILDAAGGAGGPGGGGALDAVSELLKGQGGVGGLVAGFTKNGLGDAAASWLGGGDNHAIGADQISAVLGSGPIGDFAAKLGISPAQAASTLAMLLPIVIDKLTPDGRADQADAQLTQLPGGLGDLIGGALSGKGGQDMLGGLLGGLLKR